METLRIALATVGCRANQADSAALAKVLLSYQVEIVSDFSTADFVFVNTCCVTTEAERDCRKTVRRALAASDNLRVIVFGCAARAISGFCSDLSGRVEVASQDELNFEALVKKITKSRELSKQHSKTANTLPGILGRTRALQKIQTGCSHFCSYCIVPKARGKERSLPEALVLEEVSAFVHQGYKEIVLTGVQLGAWGVDLPGKPRLSNLIVNIADSIGPARLRLSSIEPWSVDEALMDVMARHDRICPHLHLPLQSGDDSVLKAMRRGYTAKEYLDKVALAKDRIPGIAIGTDVLLGFPCESESAFKNTMDTLTKMEPAYLHAFSFSKRPGTEAAKMTNELKKGAIKERTKLIRQMGERFAFCYRTSNIGKTCEVVVEEKRGKKLNGLTETFIPVLVTTSEVPPGNLVKCKLGPMDTATGRLFAEPDQRA